MSFKIINVSEKEHLEVGREIIRNEPLISILKKRADMRVLDLGCRVPDFMWLMYHIYNCKIVIGVDSNSERGIMWTSGELMSAEDYEIYRKLPSLFDWYKELVKPDPDEPPLLLKKKEYDRKFKVHYRTKIEDFLSAARSKFDYINASNVLHFIREQKTLEKALRHIKRILKPDGLVFIRIQTGEQREYFDYERFVVLLKELFPCGVLCECQDEEKGMVATFRNFDL